MDKPDGETPIQCTVDGMSEVPAEFTKRPFTTQEARSLGVRTEWLRGAHLRAPFRGVRVAAELPDDLQTRCAAAALVVPAGTAFSHATAAAVRSLPLPPRVDPLTPLHVSVARGNEAPDLRGIQGHVTAWLPGDVVEHHGLRVTSIERTWCDLAADNWNLVELVIIADAALRLGPKDARERLADRVRLWAGRRGSPMLRQALELTEERVDSPMETRLRLLLIDAGLPRPLVNVPVCDEGGQWIHTPDLSWPRWRVAADYDGAHHFTGQERRRRLDIGRKEALEEHGWVLRVMTSIDVLERPDLAVHRVRQALRQRGASV